MRRDDMKQREGCGRDFSGLPAITFKQYAPDSSMKLFVHTILCSLSLVGAPASFAAGKQLTGAYAPAAGQPLAPAEAQKKFIVSEGFEVRLFAAEPDVINPV